MNDELLTEFLRLERLGTPTGQMVKILGVTDRTITRWRVAHGLTRRERQEKIPDTIRAQARALIEDGCSFHETARTVGVCDSTLKRWFPDLEPWTPRQAGTHAALVRRYAT